MLDLVYHISNPLFMTVVDGSIFLKIGKTINWEKNIARRYNFYSAITMMKL